MSLRVQMPDCRDSRQLAPGEDEEQSTLWWDGQGLGMEVKPRVQ